MGLDRFIVKTRRYSNMRIWMGIAQSKAWGELRRSSTMKTYNLFGFFAEVFKGLFLWFLELQANAFRMVFRVKWGSQSTGFIVNFSTAIWMLFFGHAHGWDSTLDLFQSLGKAFWAVLSDFQPNWSQISNDVWKPKSQFLAIHLGLFCFSSLVQMIGMGFKKSWRDTDNPLQKGNSLWFLLFRSKINLQQSYFVTFFEPAVLFLCGYALLIYSGDGLYAWFVLLSSGALFIQEFLDYSAQKLLIK